MNELRPDFAQVMHLLSRVVGIAPPGLLMGLIEGGQVGCAFAPGVINGHPVSQTAIVVVA